MIYKRLSDAPPVVRMFLYCFDGFLVGGAAKYIVGESDKEPKDWDIVVPLSKWSLAMKAIPKGARTNTFGGIKIQTGQDTIDIWSQDISDYLSNISTDDFYVLHPKTLVTLRGSRGMK